MSGAVEELGLKSRDANGHGCQFVEMVHHGG